MDLSTLELDANRENAAEPFARRALEVIGDVASDPEALAFRAMAEARLGEVRRVQGQTAEAVRLLASAHRTLADQRDAESHDSTLLARLDSTQRLLARARIDAGDLDGALNEYQDLLRRAEPCDERATPGPACRTLGVLESWTADVYAAVDRPNLNEPDRAVPLYEHALRIQQRIAALDDRDRQAHFDLAARYGKLGDAVWMTNPQRAIDLYDNAIATAKTLVSKEQYQIFEWAYSIAISRPLILLHRFTEARKALGPALEAARADAQVPHAQYADRLGDISTRQVLPRLLVAEGKADQAKDVLRGMIKDLDLLRAENTGDLTPIFYLADAYRELASISTGAERRNAFLASAAAWHSWPATSFTKREEQRDIDAAAR
jgi:tetratricopeptide (TPR) repeat protein